MFNKIIRSINGILSLTAYTLNTIFWVSFILIFTIFKVIIPLTAWRNICSRILNWLANTWVRVNILNQKIFSRVEIQVEGLEGLRRDNWYLVTANHQSWVDILVLQNIFYGKIPFLKFFLKKELIWFPVLGAAWWALDFPFMKRYSVSYLKKHPHLKGKDLEITKKACEKFKNIPITVMSFVEGTRFKKDKHKRQNSPYNNLLKPKAGGLAFVLAAMEDQIHLILDVTIIYPDGRKTFWEYVCGDIRKIKVQVKCFPITKEMIGNYLQDRKFRIKFQQLLNTLWKKKDLYISREIGKS